MDSNRKSNKTYRLDYVITRATTLDDTLRDLPIQEFVVIPGKVFFTLEEAETIRVDLSRKAKDGYYRVVENN